MCFFRSFLLLIAFQLALPQAGTAQRKAFNIDTRPSGAVVFINGAESGTTPYVYRYDKTPTSALTVEVRLEGRSPRSVDIGPILRDAFAVKRTLFLDLYNEYAVGLQKVELPFLPVLNETTPTDGSYGKIGGRKLQAASRELRDLGYPEELSSSILSALRGTFATAFSVRRSTQKGEEAIRRAKVYVQPALKKVMMDLVEHDDHVYGTVDLDVEWRFMSGIDTDSLLFTLQRHSTCDVFGEYPSQALSSGMRAAAHTMIDEEDLRERLMAIHTEGLVRSKGGRVEVVRPKPIPFNGRKEMLAALVKGVATVKTKDGFGSGFLVTNDGYIITNAHVVGDQGTVNVRFNQGFSLDGQVVKVNKDFDLALIKTPGNDMPALTLGDDTQLLIGEELFAIGTPLDEDLGQTVTRGIMSGRREFSGRTFIQTDVSINPGNSGGPLIDETGKVVGITTSKVSETGVQGIGFAVPTSKMLEMLNLQFVEH